MTPPEHALIDSLGSRWQLDDCIVAACFDAGGHLALALGDGSVHLRAPGMASPLQAIQVHEGACLCLSGAPRGGFLTGGDDGRFVRIGADGALQTLAHHPGRWVDHVAAHAGGMVACSVGRKLFLYGTDTSKPPLVHEYPSTVGGLCFSPDGRRIAVAHYGGVSLRSTRHAGGDSQVFAWAGSHLGVAWSPNARFVLSMMQEDCIRGWRLEDKADLRMGGYQRKITSWSWVERGRYLATSGADCVPCWPFVTRKGPMNQQPLTVGYRAECLVTAVAGDPHRPMVAAGYADGVVLLCMLDDQIPALVKGVGSAAVTALAYASDGRALAFGCEDGEAGWIPLPA
jgi:WD40 repeat protein